LAASTLEPPTFAAMPCTSSPRDLPPNTAPWWSSSSTWLEWSATAPWPGPLSDSGLAELRRQLTYKATWYGSRLIVADRFYPSSKTCSACGWVKAKLTLAERTFTCVEPTVRPSLLGRWP
jgi:hypothetical protein